MRRTMKRAAYGAALASVLSVAGCSKTLDQRFQAMCDEQKATDPETWAEAKGICEKAKYMPPAIKEQAIDGWEKIKEMRAKIQKDTSQ